MAETAASDVLELKIKTLDAQEFAVQVNKSASVPDLKAKVAERGGCPVDSQRLIYRGRVLNDDQTLSDYRIENGHVLHLVARQPPAQNEEDDDEPPPLEDLGQQDVTSHILGSIAIDGGEGIPNLDQILSSVFTSLGLPGGVPPFAQAGAPGDVETRTIEMHFDIPASAYAGQGLQPARGVSFPPPARAAGQGPRGRGDTLSTMSNFMRHLERRMQAHIDILRQHGTSAPVRPPGNLPAPSARAATTAAGGGATSASMSNTPSPAATGTAEGNAANAQVPAPPAAVPAPAALGVQGGGGQGPEGTRQAATAFPRSALLAGLLGRTQTLLQQQADPLLSIMHERLANEASIVDAGERGATQADLQIGGSLLQGLGALLLELGRATRSVNLNTEPGQAIVHATAPVFVSNTGILSNLNQAQNVGVPLPQPAFPQAQVPGAVVLQVQSAAPMIPLQVPGTPAQVVLQLAPQQAGGPRAFPQAVQVGDPQLGMQAGGQVVGPNGGVMMQLLPNGTLAPLQGGPPAGSVFVGSVPGNATTTTLQQAYQGAQAAQAQAQAQQAQQMQNMLGSLLGAFMPPQQPPSGGLAQLFANGGANAQPAVQPAPPAARAPAEGERSAGGGPAGGNGNVASGFQQQGGPNGTPAQQGRGVQQRGAQTVPPPGVPMGGMVDGAALMSMIAPVLQQLSGPGVNIHVAPGGNGGQQAAGGPQQQAPGAAQWPQASPFHFPAPAPQPGPSTSQPQQAPGLPTFTVTRNVAVPGGTLRTTTVTYGTPGPQPETNPSGGNNRQANAQGPGQAARQSPPDEAETRPGASEAAPGGLETTQQNLLGSSQATGAPSTTAQANVQPATAVRAPTSGVGGTQAAGGGDAADQGKEEETNGRKEPANVGGLSGGGPAAEGSSGGRAGPAGLGGAGLQPLLPRSRRRPAPRSDQQGRDSLAALSQMLQGAPGAGPSAAPRSTPPPLGDLMGSVMQAMGGQGGGSGGAGGLGGMLGQLMSNPGVDQMMRQVMGDDGAGSEDNVPDLGNMMSRMMPMVAQMLGGGGGGGSSGGRSAGVRQRQADGEEGWQEALSEEERPRWEATIARDEAAQAGAGPQRPLSDAYLRGSPAKRQRTGLDGTAFLMQSAQNPGEVLESMARSVSSELAREGEAAFRDGANEGLVPHVSQSERLAEAYVDTLVEDVVARAQSNPDFGDGSKYPKTKEAATEKKDGQK